MRRVCLGIWLGIAVCTLACESRTSSTALSKTTEDKPAIASPIDAGARAVASPIVAPTLVSADARSRVETLNAKLVAERASTESPARFDAQWRHAFVGASYGTVDAARTPLAVFLREQKLSDTSWECSVFGIERFRANASRVLCSATSSSDWDFAVVGYFPNSFRPQKGEVVLFSGLDTLMPAEGDASRLQLLNMSDNALSYSVVKMEPGHVLPLASNERSADHLLVSGDAAWWINSGRGDSGGAGDGAIRRVDLRTGAIRTVFSGRPYPEVLAAAGDVVVWSDGLVSPKLLRAASNGKGPIVTLAKARAFGITIDADWVYWTTEGAVNRTPLGGGKTEKLAEEPLEPRALIVDANFVYWAAYSSDNMEQNAVRKVPKTGGAVATLANDAYALTELASDGVNIYYPTRNSLRRVPKDGGASVQVVSLEQFEQPRSLTSDGQRLYWASEKPGSAPTIRSVSIEDGKPRVEFEGTDKIRNIAVWNDSFVWRQVAPFDPRKPTETSTVNRVVRRP